MGFMLQKWKNYVSGVLVTLITYPERMGNIIYYITFPESKQNRAKYPQEFNPNTNEDKNVHFLLVIHAFN